LVSDNTRPTSAGVPIIAGRLNVASSPALVLASSRTVHCITPAALVVRHQTG